MAPVALILDRPRRETNGPSTRLFAGSGMILKLGSDRFTQGSSVIRLQVSDSRAGPGVQPRSERARLTASDRNATHGHTRRIHEQRKKVEEPRCEAQEPEPTAEITVPDMERRRTEAENGEYDLGWPSIEPGRP